MNRCLVHAINAIREARKFDCPAPVEPIMDFVVECGIDGETLDEMIAAPSDVDTGRIHVYFTCKENEAAAKAAAKKKAPAKKKAKKKAAKKKASK